MRVGQLQVWCRVAQVARRQHARAWPSSGCCAITLIQSGAVGIHARRADRCLAPIHWQGSVRAGTARARADSGQGSGDRFRKRVEWRILRDGGLAAQAPLLPWASTTSPAACGDGPPEPTWYQRDESRALRYTRSGLSLGLHSPSVVSLGLGKTVQLALLDGLRGTPSRHKNAVTELARSLCSGRDGRTHGREMSAAPPFAMRLRAWL